jgi:Lon protease-like protein
MRSDFVLPLLPLDEAVLFPGGEMRLVGRSRLERGVLAESQSFGDRLIASLKDGEAVHEVGVLAAVSRDEGGLRLEGLDRLRLVELVQEDPPLVKAQKFPDLPGHPAHRVLPLLRLLGARFDKLCRNLGRPAGAMPGTDLAALTWQVAAAIGLSVEQQQGFLNIPDPVTRGRLLLAAVRDVERRERFLRPWAHLRPAADWN